MASKNFRNLGFFIFLFLSIFFTLSLVLQRQIFFKKAAEGPQSISFSSSPSRKIARIWPNFSQGGEENTLMLSPASEQIKKIAPQYIRIDHMFDFSNLDSRVEEIINLGAIPFLSLSYFPPDISPSLTQLPTSFEKWQSLIEKTVQKYSGKNEKNISGIYYEVWNEPDLFGKMHANDYSSLYQATVQAALKCKNCNDFKIGGPAITTLKKDWMNSFLNFVKKNNVRLDFLSWHSYQIDPQKTYSESQNIKTIVNSFNFTKIPELIISEAGSVPENSSIHDSYFDASHSIEAISLLENSIDKIFSFELKDGPDPQGKKYWGRWGILTHQTFGITPKPRYYSFLYLNKLLDYKLNLLDKSSNISGLGSTDGKEAFVVVASISQTGTYPSKIIIKDIPQGLYTANIYTLSSQGNPMIPKTDQSSFNGGDFFINLASPPFSTFLVELNRTSPALIKTNGRTNDPNDYSAKLTSFIPPLVFPINLLKEFLNGEINFWFKPNWGNSDTLPHTLIESKDKFGNGFKLWAENNNESMLLNFGAIKENQLSTQPPQSSLPLHWKTNSWHNVIVSIDNSTKKVYVKVDEEQNIFELAVNQTISIGERLFIGSSSNSDNNSEGSFDDIQIIINNELLYQETF